MTPNVAMGLAVPNVANRSGSGERNKDAQAEAGRFDEALAGGAGKRKPADAGPRNRAEAAEPAWRRINAYGTKLGPNAAAGLEKTALLGHMDDFGLEAGAEQPAVADAFADLGLEAPVVEDMMVLPPDAPAAEESEAGVDAGLHDAQPAPQAVDSAVAMLRALTAERDTRTGAAPLEANDTDADAVPEEPVADEPRRTAPQGGADTHGVASNSTVAAGVAGQTTVANTDRRAARTDARQDQQPAPTAAASRPAVQQQAPSTTPAAAHAPAAEQLQRPGATPAQVEAVRPPAEPAADFQPQDRAARTAAQVSQTASAASQDPLAAKVNVLGFSTTLAPAPAVPPLLPGTTAAGLVTAIEGETSWRQAAAETALAAGQRNPSFAAGVNTLRIQLHPAELGMVTARLTVSGSQLSIEIQVETGDARQRLTSDSDAILKALRGIGYDVEKVTIQQTSQSGQTNAQGSGGGRDQLQADQQQGRQEAGARGQGGRDAAGRGSGGSGHGHGEAAAERSGGGVYI